MSAVAKSPLIIFPEKAVELFHWPDGRAFVDSSTLSSPSPAPGDSMMPPFEKAANSQPYPSTLPG
jgi:hypothetical protein